MAENKLTALMMYVFYMLLAFHACNWLDRNNLRKSFRLFRKKIVLTTHLGFEKYVGK